MSADLCNDYIHLVFHAVVVTMACCAQILTLAHQLDNNVLRRGVSAGLWDDLRHLLDMLPTADTEGDPRLGMATGHRGPSILASDAAVTALEVCS